MKIKPVVFTRVSVMRAAAVPGSQVDGSVRETSSQWLELWLLIRRKGDIMRLSDLTYISLSRNLHFTCLIKNVNICKTSPIIVLFFLLSETFQYANALIPLMETCLL